MKRFYIKFLSILTLGSFLLISCEKEESDFNPKLETVYDLEFEFNNLKHSVNRPIRQIDTCISSNNFKLYFDEFENTFPNIDVLIDFANDKLNDGTVTGALKEKLQNIQAAQLLAKEEWTTLSNNLDDLKTKDIKLLFAFNALKISLFTPNFEAKSYSSSLEESYQRLFRASGLKEIAYFKARSDFNYILEYGKEIRPIEQIFHFCRLAIITYELRFQSTIYDLYGDSVKITYNSLKPLNNNENLYNLYLKNKVDFSVSSSVYEFSELSTFAENIDDCFTLLNTYENLSGYYNLFLNNFPAFIASKDSLKKISANISHIQEPEALFNQFYRSQYYNFNEVVYMANNADSVTTWRKDYNLLHSDVSRLYEQYKTADTLTNFDAIVEVKNSHTQLKNLVKSYDDHFPEYQYFFFEQFQDLSNEPETEFIKGKLYFLLDLIGLKPQEDVE